MSTLAPVQLPGYRVSLPNLEAKLTEFWQSQAKEARDEALLRASTLNLVVIVESENAFQRAMRAAPQLVSHHPCRIISAFVNPGRTTGRIEASFSAFCQMSLLSGKQICCEQINLEIPAQAKNDLPGDILPLLLPSLPVYLWWPNPSYFTIEEFPGLYQAVNQIILDMPKTFASAQSMARYAEQAIRLSSDMKVSDIGWAKLTPWREAIAQFFDLPINRESLMHLERIVCSQSRDEISSMTLLLAGWLISSLEWRMEKPVQTGKGEYGLRNPQGGKALLQIETKPGDDFFGLSAIELFTDTASQARFLASLQGRDFIRTQAWRSETLVHESQHSIAHLDEGRLLCNELDCLQTDLVYLKALKAIRELLKDSPR